MISERLGNWRWSARRLPFLNDPIRLRWRFLSYLVPWVVAVAAFFFVLFPEPPAGTSDSPLQQALQLPVATPLMIALGLAHTFGRSDFPSQTALWVTVSALLVHGCVLLSRTRLAPLIALLALQLLFFGIAVAGCLQLSNLPSGG